MNADARESPTTTNRPHATASGVTRSMFGDGKNAEVLDLVSTPSRPCLYAAAGEGPGDVVTDVVLKLTFDNTAYVEELCNDVEAAALLPDSLSSFDADLFLELFPFHVLFDRRSTIVSVGSGLQAALQYSDVIGIPGTTLQAALQYSDVIGISGTTLQTALQYSDVIGIPETTLQAALQYSDVVGISRTTLHTALQYSDVIGISGTTLQTARQYLSLIHI